MDPAVAFDAAHAEQAFLRVLCHEFRTPIASVAALARAMRRRPSSLGAEEQAEVLRLIEDHARHLAAMLESVGVVVEHLPEARQARPPAEPVELCELVAGAGWAAGLDDRLRVDIDAAVVVVRIDAIRVRRILTNLLENARVHGREPVTLRARRRTGGLELIVADRGSGLPAPLAVRAFGGGDARAFGDGTRALDGCDAWAFGGGTRALGGAASACDDDAHARDLDAGWDATSADPGAGRNGTVAAEHLGTRQATARRAHTAGSGLGLWVVAQLVAVLGGTVQTVASTPAGPGVRVVLPLAAG